MWSTVLNEFDTLVVKFILSKAPCYYLPKKLLNVCLHQAVFEKIQWTNCAIKGML